MEVTSTTGITIDIPPPRTSGFLVDVAHPIPLPCNVALPTFDLGLGPPWLVGCLLLLEEAADFVSNVFTMNKRINPVLDAKQHVCARRDKNNLESRFINTIKGYGVFATARIEEGSFLVEYRGVLRDPGQCVPDAYSYYFIYNHTRYCIDASVDDGSLGRLVNDDSNPNAKAKVISINRIPHLCLFALRDIQPGEEITYDYGGYDLPWRRGTWLSMENNSQFDSNHRKETEGQQEQETSIEGTTASQTNMECEEVPMRTDKTTQTTEQNASVDDMMWNYIPYQCLTTDDQRICENQLLLIQKTPVTQQILFEEGKRTNEDPATSRQILELQQTSMDVEPCVKEQSGPVSAAQMTDEVREMECNEDANPVSCHEPCVEEQSCPVSATQTLEQQQAHMQQVDQCKEDQESSPLSAAQSTCEEKQLTGQDKQCRIQAGEETEQQLCNNDSSRTQNATQSEADLDSRRDSSNDETESSDEDFIPDSESDDDSDGERPKKKSKATDTSKDTEEQAMPPVPNPSVIQATKLNFCFVCGKASTKISRHLKLHRKDNIEIATAFELPKSSKQRLNLLEVLRNRGNYQHNNSVLIQGSGLIKARRKPKDGIDAQKFENCMYCKGLYMRKVLWKHVKRCPSNLERDTLKSSRFVLGLAALSKCPHLKNMSEDVKKMVCDMHQDEVAQVVRNDEYLLKLAQDFFDKKGSSKERHSFVRQTVRCIGKFLVLLQNKFAIRNLAEAVKPSSFTLVIEAIKEIAEFNEETKCYAIPSLARRIGLALRKYCILSAQKAFAVGDNILIQATSTFMDLFNNANFALGEKRGLNIQSKSLLLPFVNDVRIFYCYLEKALQSALRELRETPSAQSYAALCKVTLAQILMFNRRYGEVSQMTIKSFQKRDLVQPLEISELLTELEKVFCKEERKILVRWKAGAQVPTILTSDMINAIMLLTEKREQCNVSKSNIFVFGQTRSNRFYRGETALRICAHECGATYPENLISTEFSAHISTLTQILTLKNHELKKLAKFIGHDISLRKEYYRQSEAIPRLAKICKLVLAIEKGSASEMIKQSLDDIELPEEIRESDSEDEYFEDDNTFLEDRAARRKLALENLAKYKAPKINCFASSPKRKKQDKESTAKENKSTFKEDDVQPTTEDPEAKKPAQEQQLKTVKKKVPWTREEKHAIMKHFRRHIYYGKLATVNESRRCQMLEQPVLNKRTIQKIRDFVRNAGVSFKKKRAAQRNLALASHRASPNKTSVQSPQSTNTSASSQPSSQTANPTSSVVTPSPATDIINPIILFSQNANATTTTLPPQITISTTPNAAHPQAKLLYIKVQSSHSAKQDTAGLPLPSQTENPSKIPQAADLTKSIILIPQVPNQTSSSEPPPHLMCAGVLIPQTDYPTPYTLLTPPAATAEGSNTVRPQIAILKSSQCKSTPPAADISNSNT